jgi:translocation and assembly module TamB
MDDGSWVRVEKLTLSFSAKMIISNKIIISEIRAINGTIFSNLEIKASDSSFQSVEKTIKNANEAISNAAQKVFSQDQTIQWNSFSANNMSIEHKEVSFRVDSISINKYKKVLDCIANLEEIAFSEKYNQERIDELALSFEITREFINIRELKLKKELSSLEASFTQYLNKYEFPQGKIALSAPVAELNRFEYFRGKIEEEGSVSIALATSKNEVDIALSGDHFYFKKLNIKNVNAKILIKNEQIILENAEVEMNGGTVGLNKKMNLSESFKNADYKLDLNVEAVEIKEVLPALEIQNISLGGKFSGALFIEKANEGIVIQIKKSNIDKAALWANQYLILELRKLDIDYVILNFRDEIISYKLTYDSEVISGQGKLSLHDLNIEGDLARLNLNKIKHIANVPFFGDLIVTHKLYQTENNQLILILAGSLNKFQVSNFYLGDAKAEVLINLSEGNIGIKNFNGNVNGSDYFGDGLINFSKPGEALNLKISSKKMGVENLFKMLPTILGVLPVDQQKIVGPVEIDLILSGGFDLNSLYLGATVSSSESVYVYGERIDQMKAQVIIKDSILELSIDSLKKGNGLIKGKYSLNIETNYHDLYFDINNLSLEQIKNYADLGLGLRGYLDGTIYGNGSAELFNSKLQIRIKESSIRKKNYPDTFFNLFLTNKEIEYNFNVAANLIKGAGTYPLKENGPYAISLVVSARDIRDILGFFKPEITENDAFAGELAFSLDMKGADSDLRKSNINFFIEKLFLDYKNSHLMLQSAENMIKVENGEIEEWNIQLRDEGGNRLYSRAKGKLSSSAKIEAGFNAPFNLVEVIIPHVEDVQGRVSGQLYIDYRADDFKLNAEYQGHDISINSDLLPGEFKKINFTINQNKNNFNIQHFHGLYQDGSIDLFGKADFSSFIPNVDIQLVANEITIPLNKESSVSMDVKSRLSGEKFPYNFKTDIFINRGRIYDEFYTFKIAKFKKSANDFSVESLKSKKSEKKIVMKNNLIILNPFHIRNNLLDIKVTGGVGHILEGNNNYFSGKIEVASGQGKIKFKGYDFIIREGYIEGAPSVDMGYNLRLVGESKINEYLVAIEVVGNENNISVNFRSQPPLPQEDLLSLLTLGVPLNVSKNLGSSDLRSVTGVGVGNILFDQFGLNEGLDRSLGVKLSVSPDFIDDANSPIRGRTSAQEQVVSRTRSNTKIRINKRINKQMDFSFAGTVGGSTDNRQEMNVNYRLDRNFSLQGIYEIRSDDSTEGAINTNSLGLDLIWKRSF